MNPARNRAKRRVRKSRGDASAVLDALMRMATDQSESVAKMQQLTAVFEKLRAQDAETDFGVALAHLQAELPEIDENGVILGADGAPVATYATWEDTLKAIRPILFSHGFSLSFRPGRSAAGYPTVTGILRHIGGHREEGELELPPDTSGGKNALQAIGSATAYGQRYVARMLLNLASRGGDDDGVSAMMTSEAAEAVAEINALQRIPSLSDWKRRNRLLLATLPPPDFRQVVGRYADRLRELTPPAGGDAA
jgi:hypothetical protein